VLAMRRFSLRFAPEAERRFCDAQYETLLTRMRVVYAVLGAMMLVSCVTTYDVERRWSAAHGGRADGADIDRWLKIIAAAAMLAITALPAQARWRRLRVGLVYVSALFAMLTILMPQHVLGGLGEITIAYDPSALATGSAALYFASTLVFADAFVLTAVSLGLFFGDRGVFFAHDLPFDWMYAGIFSIVIFQVMIVLIARASERQARTNFSLMEELAEEKLRSETLLYEMLPHTVAARLRRSREMIVERFDEVTIVFADLVGFTAMAERADPAEVVGLLDRLFTRFDALAEEHRLEKIKTIGDAYMVIGGAPERRTDHLESALAMAIAMQGVVAEIGAGLAIRIGVHVGPAVAGVIGAKKYTYDLWGDAVNVASRMESHGLPGRIHVSDAVAVRLNGRVALEDRGLIEVKGKGALRTWFLASPT
jgi:class 3 adenylate cyclase